MSSLIEIEAEQFERLIRKVRAAADADLAPLLHDIGQQQESAARHRILRSKRAPSGERWDPWSKRHAKTRKPQHSLLRESGLLERTMSHQVETSSASVLVGSPMVYAGAQLYGTDRIPAREYLDTQPGFADADDREAIRDLTLDFLGELLS